MPPAQRGRTAPRALLLALFASSAALEAPTAFWREVDSGSSVAACWPNSSTYSYADLRPRYRLTVSDQGALGGAALVLGAEAHASVDTLRAILPSNGTFPYVVRSSDGGHNWACGDDLPVAQRYAAVPFSYAPPEAFGGCRIACLMGGNELQDQTMLLPQTSGSCTTDAGSSWFTPVGFGSADSFPLLGAASATNGTTVYFIGGVIRPAGMVGPYVPAGVWQLQVITSGTCDITGLQQLYRDDELPVSMRGRMFSGATVLTIRNRFALQGGCLVDSVPGFGIPPANCSLNDLWTTSNITDPLSWRKTTLKGDVVSALAEDLTPPMIAELHADTDMLQPFNGDFVQTFVGMPGLLLITRGSAFMAQTAGDTPFMTLSSKVETTGAVGVLMNPFLSAFLYEGRRPYMLGFLNSALYRAAIGSCSAQCEEGQWGLPCSSGLYRPICAPCKTDCGAGQWLAGQCTAQLDGWCSACSPCTLPDVQIGGCDGVNDTICGPAPTPSATPSTTATATPSCSLSVTASASTSASFTGTATPSSPVVSASVTASFPQPAPSTNSTAPGLDEKIKAPPGLTVPTSVADFAVVSTLLSAAGVVAVLLTQNMCSCMRYKGHAAARSLPGNSDPLAAAGAASTEWALVTLLHLLSLWWHVALAASLVSHISTLAVSCATVIFCLLLMRIATAALVTHSLVDGRAQFASWSRNMRVAALVSAVMLVACSHVRALRQLTMPETCLLQSPADFRSVRRAVHLRITVVIVPTLLLDIVAVVQFIGDTGSTWILLLLGCILCLLLELSSAVSCSQLLWRMQLGTHTSMQAYNGGKPGGIADFGGRVADTTAGEGVDAVIQNPVRHLIASPSPADPQRARHAAMAQHVTAADHVGSSTRRAHVVANLGRRQVEDGVVVDSALVGSTSSAMAVVGSSAQQPALRPLSSAPLGPNPAVPAIRTSAELTAYMGSVNSLLATAASAHVLSAALGGGDDHGPHSGARVAINPRMLMSDMSSEGSGDSLADDADDDECCDANGDVTCPTALTFHTGAAHQHGNGLVAGSSVMDSMRSQPAFPSLAVSPRPSDQSPYGTAAVRVPHASSGLAHLSALPWVTTLQPGVRTDRTPDDPQQPAE